MMDPMNPATSGGLFSVYGMMQKIDLPGITGQNKSLTCYTTGKGSSKCFELSTSNAVKCKGNSCFVAYQTFNQRIIGAASGIKRLGLDALMIPNGLSTRVILAGEIDRKKLGSLKKVIGRFDVEEIKTDLPKIYDGLPIPPGKCHLNPFSSDCSIYLSSSEWSWIPGIGLKNSIEIATNPKTLLKSEVIPELKKFAESAKQLLKKPAMAAKGAEISAQRPMQSKLSEKTGMQKINARNNS